MVDTFSELLKRFMSKTAAEFALSPGGEKSTGLYLAMRQKLSKLRFHALLELIAKRVKVAGPT